MHARQSTRPAYRRPYSPVELAAATRKMSVAECMANTMRAQHAKGGCTSESLLDAGYTLVEIENHKTEARRIARKQAVRQIDDLDPAEVRAERIEKAANLAIGLVSDSAIVSYLLSNNFTATELSDILPEVIDRICHLLVTSRTPAEAH